MFKVSPNLKLRPKVDVFKAFKDLIPEDKVEIDLDQFFVFVYKT